MSLTNKQCVLKGKQHIDVEDGAMPKDPGPNEVLLETKAVGVCGSDVHWFEHFQIGSKVAKSPFCLGHECSARVVKVGEGVTNVKPGDRVAVEPGLPCRMCSQCKEGHYNLCPQMPFLGSWPVNGALQNFFVHQADWVYPLPSHMSYAEGALLEPLSVGVYACERGEVRNGSRVLVIGAGPVGIVTMLAAKAAGAVSVGMVDLLEERLQLARTFGADMTFNSKSCSAEEIRGLIGNGGADVALDCAGLESTFRLAMECCRPNGNAILVGMLHAEMKLPTLDCCIRREVTVRGVFRYRNVYQKSLDLVASGKVNVKQLHTHTVPIDKVAEGLDICKTCRDGAIKVIIDVSGDAVLK